MNDTIRQRLVADFVNWHAIHYNEKSFAKHLFHLFPSATFRLSVVYECSRWKQMKQMSIIYESVCPELFIGHSIADEQEKLATFDQFVVPLCCLRYNTNNESKQKFFIFRGIILFLCRFSLPLQCIVFPWTLCRTSWVIKNCIENSEEVHFQKVGKTCL